MRQRNSNSKFVLTNTCFLLKKLSTQDLNHTVLYRFPFLLRTKNCPITLKMRQVKNKTNREFMGTETLFSFNCIEMRQFRAENQERQIDHVSVLLKEIFKKPSIFLSIQSFAIFHLRTNRKNRDLSVYHGSCSCMFNLYLFASACVCVCLYVNCDTSQLYVGTYTQVHIHTYRRGEKLHRIIFFIYRVYRSRRYMDYNKDETIGKPSNVRILHFEQAGLLFSLM